MTMTVTDVCVVGMGGNIGSDYIRGYTVTYRFKYTGDLDYVGIVKGNYLALPKMGSTAAWDTGVYLSGISNIKDIGGGYASYDASFTLNVWIDTKDKLEVDMCEEAVEVFLDQTNKPIVNKANQVFESCPTVPRMIETLTVTGYRTSYKIPDAPDKQDYYLVNAGNVTLDGKTYPAGELAYAGTQTQRVIVEGYTGFIQHRWMFRRKKDWDLHVPNMGTIDKDGYRIKINGRYVETPYPLDANGKPLAPGFDPATVPILTFDITKDLDFGMFAFNF